MRDFFLTFILSLFILTFMFSSAVSIGTTVRLEGTSGSSILADLVKGGQIPLSDPRFSKYAQICLIGYDLIGEPLEKCRGVEEDSVVAISRENSACINLIKRRNLRAIKLHVLMDGHVQCMNVNSDKSLVVVRGVPGLTDDRIDISYNVH